MKFNFKYKPEGKRFTSRDVDISPFASRVFLNKQKLK